MFNPLCRNVLVKYDKYWKLHFIAQCLLSYKPSDKIYDLVLTVWATHSCVGSSANIFCVSLLCI